MCYFFLLPLTPSLLSPFPLYPPHLHQPFTSHTVRLGTMYETLALFKASGSSPFMPCCEKAQIWMLCFHSPSFKGDIKSICGRLAGLENILCFMKRGCGVHTHSYRDLKLTDQSLTSKNNKPALSQDPHCQVSLQMRSICGRWVHRCLPACHNDRNCSCVHFQVFFPLANVLRYW